MDISFSKAAAKALRKSDKAELIMAKIEQLAIDPDSMAANIKKLVGRPESRLRVQDWRVIFLFEADATLLIIDVASRGSIY